MTERKIVILDNLRSGHNVGNIYRNAYSFSYSEIIHVGITPETNNPSFLASSRGCEKHIKSIRVGHIKEAISYARENKLSVYSLEIHERAENLSKIRETYNFALILGNEALGVSEEALENSDKIIRIDTPGFKDSLNVAVSFGIFSYTLFMRSIG